MGDIMKLVKTFYEHHMNFIDYTTNTCYRYVIITDASSNEPEDSRWERLEDECVWVRVNDDDDLRSLNSFIGKQYDR